MSKSKVIGVRVTEMHLKRLEQIREYMSHTHSNFEPLAGRKYNKYTFTNQDALLFAAMNVNVADLFDKREVQKENVFEKLRLARKEQKH